MEPTLPLGWTEPGEQPGVAGIAGPQALALGLVWLLLDLLALARARLP